MISAGLSFGMSTGSCGGALLRDEVLVAAVRPPSVGAAGDDDGGQRRREVADRDGDGGEHRLGDDHRGLAVLDQEGQLRRGQPEVDRNRDGAEPVGRQRGFDELGAVEHQDHHPVTEADSASAEGIGQRWSTR